MSLKKVILGYPTVSKFIEYTKKRRFEKSDKLTVCLNDYFGSTSSIIRPSISNNDFNILVLNTASKQISSNVANIVADYERYFGKIKKQIKVFIVEHNYPMDVIGRFPFIISLLDRDIMSSIFEIIICQCELLNSPIIPHLKDFIKVDGLLICDKKLRLNVDDVQGWSRVKMSDDFHTFQPVMSDRTDLSFEINDSDITLDHFLRWTSSKNLDQTTLDEYVKDFIHSYIERSPHKIRLLRGSFNILVMCSNTPSIRRQKFLDILQRSTGSDIGLDDSVIYQIGKDIYKEDNTIFRGIIERLEILNDIKFDMIISEHCPTVSLVNSLGHIKRLLKDEGALITPVTSFEKKIPFGFDTAYSYSQDYMILIKDHSSPSDESTALSSYNSFDGYKECGYTDTDISSITAEDSMTISDSKSSIERCADSKNNSITSLASADSKSSYDSYESYDSFNIESKLPEYHNKRRGAISTGTGKRNIISEYK